jgi:hypothetical protein
MDETKMDDFVAMVEHAKTLYIEGGGGARNYQSGSESKARMIRTPIIRLHSNKKCNVWMT